MIGAVLVIFMQAGFALVETGFCRAKHAAHVVATNFAIFGLGFVGFFLVGYAFAFGGASFGAYIPGYEAPLGGALIGSGNWTFLWSGGFAMSGDKITPGVLGMFLYMVAFMDTVATIPTGSMAERWKWNSFVGWGLFCGAIYYPLFAAWTWGGGLLAKTWDTMSLGAGYVDFAGSGVVHAVGGVAALAGAKVLGPRIGKFHRTARPTPSPATTSRWRCSARSSCCSAGSASTPPRPSRPPTSSSPRWPTNTAIAGAFGAVATMFVMMAKTGKPDPGMMANGMLAGLVAITAPCAFTSPDVVGAHRHHRRRPRRLRRRRSSRTC